MTTELRSDGVRLLLRMCTACSAVAWTAVLVAGPGPDPGLGDYIFAALFGVVMSLAFFRGTRMRIELTEAGVRLYRYWDTRFVPWGEIRDVAVGYSGLSIIRKDGTSVATVALGKSNWSKWTHTRTAADYAVTRIREAIRIHTA